MQEEKGRTVCFGTNYRAAPEVLHGYSQSLKEKKQLTGARASAHFPAPISGPHARRRLRGDGLHERSAPFPARSQPRRGSTCGQRRRRTSSANEVRTGLPRRIVCGNRREVVLSRS